MHVHPFAKKASVTGMDHELKLSSKYSQDGRALWREQKGISKLSGEYESRKRVHVKLLPC